MTDSSIEKTAIRTSLVAGRTGSVVGTTPGLLGAATAKLTLGTAGYVYGHSTAAQRDAGRSPDVDTA